MAKIRSSARPGLWVALTLATALAAALALPGGTSAEDRVQEIPYDTPDPNQLPQLDPSYRMSSHKVVLITDDELRPRRVELKRAQLVAWISYSRAPSVVVFEREVGRSMVCHSLVNFKIKDDEIRSSPIQAGEFASFCELKPGRYKYKVVRPGGKERDRAARTVLEGEIVVEAEGGA